MSRITLSLLAAAALATGCVAHGHGQVGYSATYTATTPDLVYVSPGVQVIADYDEPVFYSDNFYWRFYGGTWYRSRYHTGGWAYASPPRAVISINDPYRYRRYRPAGYVRRDHGGYRREPVRDRAPYRQPATREPARQQPVVRDHGRAAPVVRDHRPAERREERREERRDTRPARGPVIRDHR